MTWCGHDHGQVNTKLCQKSSFPPSPTFLFLSKQYLLCSSQTVVPFKRHSVLLPSGPFSRLLWCLEPRQASVLKVLSSEWLCAIPLSPFEVFCTFPASAGPSQCSAPMGMQNTSSQIGSGVQVSPGQMVLGGRSLPPSSTLESFGGCE